MCPQPDFYRFLPHRPPMLLLDRLVEVEATRSESEIIITPVSSFFIEKKGVPAWIGIEYMGQTAATIAGFQLEAGALAPHVGLLLGTRKYKTELEWFAPGVLLRVRCKELNVMQGSVASFQCEIAQLERAGQPQNVIASANLTVYRTNINPPTS